METEGGFVHVVACVRFIPLIQSPTQSWVKFICKAWLGSITEIMAAHIILLYDVKDLKLKFLSTISFLLREKAFEFQSSHKYKNLDEDSTRFLSTTTKISWKILPSFIIWAALLFIVLFIPLFVVYFVGVNYKKNYK